MSRRKKSKTKESKGRRSPGKQKMSDMISDIGWSFIDFGDTLEEKHNRLNAVCSAWNMACATPEHRERQLDQYMEGFRQFNPDSSEEELNQVRNDMQTLIQRKLKMFPADQRQIVDTRILPLGEDFRIEIASATVH